jgi:nucleotide-binding universal stress UspA family protein
MKILVCTEGSERGQKVLSLAAMVAGPANASAIILGITENATDESRVRQKLARAVDEFRGRQIEIDLLIRYGDPVEKILVEVKETKPDLVIIGAERKKSKGPFLLSAKAYSIVSVLPVPVLLVPRVRLQLKKFLICTGGGSYIDNAVRFTAELARSLGAAVTLLNVVPQPPAMHGGLLKREQDSESVLNSRSTLARNLRTEKEILEQTGIPAVVRIRHGIVIDQILEELEEGDHDVVVVGSFPGTDRVRRYIIGNLTREIVNRCERPILVVRSDQKASSFFGFLARAGRRNQSL